MARHRPGPHARSASRDPSTARPPRDGWVLEFRLALLLSAVAIALLHPLTNGTSAPAAAPARAAPPATSAQRDPEETSKKQPGSRAEKDEIVFEGTGRLRIVAGTDPAPEREPVRTFSVEVEDGLPVRPGPFARRVTEILSSPKSWGGLEGFAVRRVDHDDADVRVILASPDTTDRLCQPLDTQGTQSCQRQNRAILNAWRWLQGADSYGNDLASYRIYMVNHEVGHVWMHPHLSCPAPGAPAPVMVQQTLGVEPCDPNPWPLESEAHT